MFLESSLALPFRNKTYGVYAAGNAVSLIGTWMQRISVSWLTWEMTHSGLWLGIMAFADFFPGLVVSPLAGAFADRTDQLTVVKSSQVVSLLQAMVLFGLTATHHLNISGLVALTAFQGAVVAFNQPARLALVPSLVPESDLGSAVAINSVIFNVARFIGPMVAGLVIVWSGVAASFGANAVSYAVFLVALWWVRIGDTAAKPPKRRKFATDFKEGIRYTVTHPAIGSLLLLLTAIGIGGRPLNQLLPGFAAQVFHLGAGAFSILASAAGGGAILGGVWLGHRSQSAKLPAIAIVTTIAGAMAAIGVSATSNLWIAVPCVTIFGFCLSSAGIAIQTIIQLSSERSMRGRVMGVYGLIFRGAPAIGALAAGTASLHFGLQWPVIVGALIVIAAAAWTFTRHAEISEALTNSEAERINAQTVP
ncbi:MAG TPA: MFS transporter [Xanthobacteraceae bacterium]